MLAYRWLAFLHVMAAVIWVGALIYLGAVIVPAVRRLGFDERQRQRLFRELGQRTRVLGLAALALLVLTGTTLLALRGVTVGDLLAGRGAFLEILRIKLALVLGLVAAVALHDILGVRASQVAPGSPEAVRLRRRASWLGRAVTLLSAAVIYYAVRLVRG